MRKQVIMDRTIVKKADCLAIPHCSVRKQSSGAFPIGMLCIACVAFFTTEASAQCAARDVLRNHLTVRATPSADTPPAPIRSAFAVPVWRTIKVGTFANSFALLNALDAAGCGLGSSAEEVLARPAFTVGTTKAEVELFALSAAELGFQADTAPLADIFSRAEQLGFGLAAAEVAPQLRLQYFDQPMGELLVGMQPIRTWKGEPVILAVANGGAGLVLVGRDGGANAEIPVATRFVFVRSNEAALARQVDTGR